MPISTVERIARAIEVSCDANELIVQLVDGLRVAVPLEWFPRLAKATQAQLKNYELLGDGEGIHWPELDEDLSVAGLLK